MVVNVYDNQRSRLQSSFTTSLEAALIKAISSSQEVSRSRSRSLGLVPDPLWVLDHDPRLLPTQTSPALTTTQQRRHSNCFKQRAEYQSINIREKNSGLKFIVWRENSCSSNPVYKH